MLGGSYNDWAPFGSSACTGSHVHHRVKPNHHGGISSDPWFDTATQLLCILNIYLWNL